MPFAPRLAFLGFTCCTAWALAGPITPPAGPVAPTPGPEPRTPISLTTTPGDNDASPSLYKITQPGSYYLSGNITGVAGKHGVEITASGVTLDLNGFDLVGVPGMGAFDGVSVTATDIKNVAVLNGSVRAWGDAGVDLRSSNATNCRVDGVLARGNSGVGFPLGVACIITDCSASENGSGGIRTEFGCTVRNCLAYTNNGIGIRCRIGSTVINCTVYGNTLTGILTDPGCTVTACTAFDNAGNGIFVDLGSSVLNCTASINDLSGIATGGGCTVAHCTAYSNTGDGVSVGSGSTVDRCTSRSNSQNGIVSASGSMVEGCTTRFNNLDGVRCTSGCTIIGNVCAENGLSENGAGIHATGGDNRIEGNACNSTPIGIDVDVAGNLIIRNSCAGNTLIWSIAANNVYGAIVDRTAPTSVAVNTNSAAATTGTSDPNANFTY